VSRCENYTDLITRTIEIYHPPVNQLQQRFKTTQSPALADHTRYTPPPPVFPGSAYSMQSSHCQSSTVCTVRIVGTF